MYGDTISQGNWDIHVVGADGIGEKRLMGTGCSQGLEMWPHSRDRVVRIPAATGTEGECYVCAVDSDGSNSRNITPDYSPRSLLCHSAMFSKDDSKVYFTGQWWK